MARLSPLRLSSQVLNMICQLKIACAALQKKKFGTELSFKESLLRGFFPPPPVSKERVLGFRPPALSVPAVPRDLLLRHQEVTAPYWNIWWESVTHVFLIGLTLARTGCQHGYRTAVPPVGYLCQESLMRNEKI